MIVDFGSREWMRQQLLQSSSGADGADGGVWLLMGGPRSGKSSLIEMLETHHDPQYRQLVSLTASGGVMSLRAPNLVDRAAEVAVPVGMAIGLVAKIASVLGGPHVGAVMGGVGKGMRTSATVARRLSERAERSSAQPGALLTMLREFESPLLVLIDDIDEIELPEWWWSQLMFPLIDDVGGGSANLVVATAAKQPLAGETLVRAESAGLNSRVLSPLVEGDIEILTGGSTQQVARVLLDASGGQPGPVIALWREMMRAKCVQRIGGSWSLVTGHQEVTQLLATAIQRELATKLPDVDIAQAFRFLELAAISAPVFTAEAIANILDLDRDHALDLLDDIEEATEAIDPLVREVDSVPMSGKESLWRYEASDRLRDYAAQVQLSGGPERDTLSALAQSMLDVYGPMKWVVASEARHIFRLAGDSDGVAACALYANELEPSIVRAQLDTLLRGTGSSKSGAEDDYWLATSRLNEIEASLTQDELMDYAQALVRLANRIADLEKRSAALIGLSSALVVKGRAALGSRAFAKALLTDVLEAPHLSATAKVGGLMARAQISLAEAMAADTDAPHPCEGTDAQASLDAAMDAYRQTELIAREVGHGGAVGQALVMQARIGEWLGLDESLLNPLLDEFEALADPDNRAWADAAKVRIDLAARAGRRDEFRSGFDNLEASLLRRFLYRTVAESHLYKAEVEAAWIRDGIHDEGDAHLETALSDAVASALRTRDSDFISAIQQKCEAARRLANLP